MKKETTAELRKEDLGKMLVADAPPVSKEFAIGILEDFFTGISAETKHFLLYGKEVSYFSLFETDDINKEMPGGKFIEHLFYEALENSTYIDLTDKDMKSVPMTDIRFIENNKETLSLEMFIGTKYFQLMPWVVTKL